MSCCKAAADNGSVKTLPYKTLCKGGGISPRPQALLLLGGNGGGLGHNAILAAADKLLHDAQSIEGVDAAVAVDVHGEDLIVVGLPALAQSGIHDSQRILSVDDAVAVGIAKGYSTCAAARNREIALIHKILHGDCFVHDGRIG